MNKSECEIALNGTKVWWFNGQIHREDGPAIERLDGTCGWWLYDKELYLDDMIGDVKLNDLELVEVMNNYLIICLVHGS